MTRRWLYTLVVLALYPLLMAPAPTVNVVEVVNSSPAGQPCSSTNTAKLYRPTSGGLALYVCESNVWTAKQVKATDLQATNPPADGDCATYNSATGKIRWGECAAGASGGGGTSTIKEGDSAVTTTATTLDFGVGFDIVELPTSEVNIALDYTEKPVALDSGDIKGALAVANGGTGSLNATDARSALAAAKSGINADIIALTGLSTPINVTQGGLNLSSVAANQIILASASNTYVVRTMPTCLTGNQLLFKASGTCTSTGETSPCFDCEADGAAGSGTIKIIQEEGVSQGADGSGTTFNFTGAALTASGTGAVKTIALSQSPSGSTSLVGTGRTLTPGAGLSGSSAVDLSADRTLALDTSEAASVADIGSTPVSGAAGKMGVLDAGPISYTDGSSVARYTALADSDGKSLSGDSATSNFATGTVEVAVGGTGATTLGTSGEVLFNDGGVVGNPSAGTLTYTDASGGGTLGVGTIDTFGAADGERGLCIEDNVLQPAAPTTASTTALYTIGGEWYKSDSDDGATSILMLNTANYSGDVTISNNGDGTAAYAIVGEAVGITELGNDSGCTAGQVVARNAGDTAFECITASGTGDITSVGPVYTTGDAFTNGTDTGGATTGAVWEGDTVDANDYNLVFPADPAANYSFTFPPVGGTGATLAGTEALTNKTIDVEGTGNSITVVDKVWLPAAGCNNATATSFWDLPTSEAAGAACVTGSNTQKGTLDFEDGTATTAESAQVTLILPSDWTGAIDARIKWFAAATTNDVKWNLATICVADAETDDPSFNTASSVTDTAKGTTLQTNDASITGVTVTGCAAGELMHLKVSRDADNAADNMSGDARLIGIELTLRRAQ